MTHGTIDYQRIGFDWGWDPLHVQKEQDYGSSGVWRACDTHDDTSAGGAAESVSIYTHISFANSMERSVLKRGVTRRKYALCELEEDHSHEEWQDIAEFTQSVKRKYKDERCQSPRFVFGDQPFAVDGYSAEEGAPAKKRQCRNNRHAANDALRDTVFRALGSDILAHWLTPIEMYNVKCAFHCDWDWKHAWHHGPTRNPRVSAKIHLCVRLGYTVEEIQANWGTRRTMDALWYLFTAAECMRFAAEFRDIKTIRKLM